MTTLNTLLAPPDKTRVHCQVKAGCAGAENDHAAALDDVAGDREGLLTGMLEHEVDVIALARDLPDRLAELAGLLHIFREAFAVDLGKLTPAVKILAIENALRAERHHEVALAFIRNDADRVGAGGRADLNGHGAEAARGAPDQH